MIEIINIVKKFFSEFINEFKYENNTKINWYLISCMYMCKFNVYIPKIYNYNSVRNFYYTNEVEPIEI